jgi:SNF2 family DNA or RNA helicase
LAADGVAGSTAAAADKAYASLPSAKIEALLGQLRELIGGGHRALVFSQYTQFPGIIRARLEADAMPYCYLDGHTQDRAGSCGSSSRRCPGFLMSLRAGGYGLNLTAADHCFLLDPWWNPATEAQANGRVHRIGQTRDVTVYRMVARDTIEKKVLDLQARKARLFGSVIDTGQMFASTLSADDIRNLLFEN